MESYETLLATLALTMGASWASGVNLYAALLVLGIGSSTGNIDLPPELQVLQNPMVIGAAGLMYFVEFFVDKIPGVDTGWDSIHTFIRIPAGAMLAAGAVGDVTPALEIAAGIMGGTLSATSHLTKAGTRGLINTSPEPFSNWGASIAEDVSVFGGLWIALNYPVLFLVLIVIFIIFAIWMLPKIWRLLKKIGRAIGRWLGFIEKEIESEEGVLNASLISPGSASGESSSLISELERLEALKASGTLSSEEFERAKKQILA
ncbi:MAG: DUF4126 family protein [Pseudomonadales bacterium]|nr:DUF4126 family protein [Pseudomonadales bacterium]